MKAVIFSILVALTLTHPVQALEPTGGCTSCLAALADEGNRADELGKIAGRAVALDPQIIRRMDSVMGKSLPEPVNCWGVALYVLGFIETPRPAFKTEVLDFVSSGACRRLDPGEAIRAGDIGSTYNSRGGLRHSYLFLDSQHVFEKASPNGTDKPQIVNIAKKFARDKDLRSGCKIEDEYGCSSGIVNYRCDPAKIQNGSLSLSEASRRRRNLHSKSLNYLSERIEAGGEIGAAFSQNLDLLEELSRDVDAGIISPRVEREAAGLFLVQVKRIAGDKSTDPQDHLRLVKLSDRYSQMESRTPKTFNSFPSGSRH